MLESAIAEATESGYESYNVSALKLSKSADYYKLDSNQRMKIAEGVAHWLKLKHTKSNVEILLKISPKDNKNHVVLLKLLQAFLSERLDRIE